MTTVDYAMGDAGSPSASALCSVREVSPALLSGRGSAPGQGIGSLPRNRGGLPQRSLPKLIFIDW